MNCELLILKTWLRLLLQSDDKLDKSCVSSSSVKNTSTSFGPFLQSSLIMDEENADSILDEHCSRIWERSAGQTPSRSPGRSRSPERFRKPLTPHAGPASMPGTLHVKPGQGKKRTNPMSHSMSSFDSGMGDDVNNKCVETHKHYHHHHHHHHDKRKTKQRLELQAQQHSMVCWGDGTPTSHAHSGRSSRQRSGTRTSSDACSYLDSGISESCQTTQDVLDPAKSK